MRDKNKEFIEEIEELVKDKYGQDRDLKYKWMVEEIEKWYDLQIKKQSINDDEKKIEDTKEEANIENKSQNGKNYFDNIFSFGLCKSIKRFKFK